MKFATLTYLLLSCVALEAHALELKKDTRIYIRSSDASEETGLRSGTHCQVVNKQQGGTYLMNCSVVENNVCTIEPKQIDTDNYAIENGINVLEEKPTKQISTKRWGSFKANDLVADEVQAIVAQEFILRASDDTEMAYVKNDKNCWSLFSSIYHVNQKATSAFGPQLGETAVVPNGHMFEALNGTETKVKGQVITNDSEDKYPSYVMENNQVLSISDFFWGPAYQGAELGNGDYVYSKKVNKVLNAKSILGNTSRCEEGECYPTGRLSFLDSQSMQWFVWGRTNDYLLLTKKFPAELNIRVGDYILDGKVHTNSSPELAKKIEFFSYDYDSYAVTSDESVYRISFCESSEGEKFKEVCAEKVLFENEM